MKGVLGFWGIIEDLGIKNNEFVLATIHREENTNDLERFKSIFEGLEIIAQDIPLGIVFEDDDLIVINKPAGMVVHPGHGNYTDTMINALAFHFHPELKDKSIESESERPGLVHRIDKHTTGLLVVSKNEQAMTHLAKQFYDRTIERKYIALVWGDIDQEKGTITGNIGRKLTDRKIMDVFEGDEVGKHAVTHFTVLKRYGYVTLVECKLETGRTHQIRVHFKHIGHPLFNDETYGGNRVLKGTIFAKYKQFVENCFTLISGQALHARSLGLIHPVSGIKLNFEVDLPEGFRKIIEKWETYTAGGR